MSAEIITFPCRRLVGKARRLASMTYDGTFPGRFPGRSAAHASAYERRLKADIRRGLERLGVDAATIDRELLEFTQTTVSEIQRLVRMDMDAGDAFTRDGGDAA